MAQMSLDEILAKQKDGSNSVSAKQDRLMLQIKKLHNSAEYIREKNLPRYQKAWQYALEKRPLPLQGDPDLNQVIPVMAFAKARLKPALMNIFTENGSQAVAYRLNGFKRKNGTLLEAAVNNTMKRLTFGDNDVYKVLEDAMDECMTTGNAFIKYFIEHVVDKDVYPLEDWTALDDFIGILQQESAGGDEWEPDLPSGLKDDGTPYLKKGTTPYKDLEWKISPKAVGGGIDIATGKADVQTAPMMYIKGNVNCKRVNKYPRFEQIDLNDLWFDDSCGSNFEDCTFFQHRIQMPRSKAIAAGWSKRKIMDAKRYEVDDNELPYEKKNIVVDYMNPTFTNDDPMSDAYSVDPLVEPINIWNTFLRTSVWTGKVSLVQVIHTDNDVLEVITDIDEIPFVNMIYETVPGSFWGRSLFDKCQGPQDELSHIARVMKRQMSLSVFNRYIAKKAGFNRQSLQNNRPGAVIEVDEMENVMPFPPHPLDPAVIQYLSFMKDNSDNVIAASSDSFQGVEKNPQLAAQTVAMMIEQLEMKDKAIAKNIARTGIRPLFKGFFKLLKKERYHILNEDGTVIPPEMLPDSGEWTIDFSTVNDVAKQNTTLMTTMTTLAQIPESEFMTGENKSNIAEQILGSVDLDAKLFCTNPADKQVSPEEQQEQLLAQKATKEHATLDLDIKRGQKKLLAMEIMQKQIDMENAKKESAAKIEREKEKSLREFQVAQSTIALNQAKAAAEPGRVATQAAAVSAEATTGQNITGVRVPS